MDATNVYWALPSSGKLMKAPIAGGSPSVLASDSSVHLVAVHNTFAYFAGVDGAMRVPLSGGPAELLVSGQNRDSVVESPPFCASDPDAYAVTALAIDADNAYIGTREGEVMRVPLTGGVADVLVRGQAPALFVAVDETSVYWTTRGRLIAAPPCGGVSSVSVDAPGPHHPDFIYKLSPK